MQCKNNMLWLTFLVELDICWQFDHKKQTLPDRTLKVCVLLANDWRAIEASWVCRTRWKPRQVAERAVVRWGSGQLVKGTWFDLHLVSLFGINIIGNERSFWQWVMLQPIFNCYCTDHHLVKSEWKARESGFAPSITKGSVDLLCTHTHNVIICFSLF